MKMCPYCGNKINGRSRICSHCKKKVYVNNYIFIKYDKLEFFKFLIIVVLLIIIGLNLFTYIIYIKYPLMKPKEYVCYDNCGRFSFDKSYDEDYCICDNNKVYNIHTGDLSYDSLDELVDNNFETTLDKFYSQYDLGRGILVIIVNDNFKKNKKQENAIMKIILNYKVNNFHYINLDKLSTEDVGNLSYIFDKDLENDKIYSVLIKDKNVVKFKKKTFGYFDEKYLSELIENYLWE